MESMKDYYRKRYAETESNMAKIISDMVTTIDLLQAENANLRSQILKCANAKFVKDNEVEEDD